MADELERYEDMQKLCYWNHSWTVCLAACWTCHCTWLLLLCYSSHSAFEGSFRSGCIEKLCFWKVFIPMFNLKLLVLMRHGNKDSNSLWGESNWVSYSHICNQYPEHASGTPFLLMHFLYSKSLLSFHACCYLILESCCILYIWVFCTGIWNVETF